MDTELAMEFGTIWVERKYLSGSLSTSST